MKERDMEVWRGWNEGFLELKEIVAPCRGDFTKFHTPCSTTSKVTMLKVLIVSCTEG
jgi:hypothetical protein